MAYRVLTILLVFALPTHARADRSWYCGVLAWLTPWRTVSRNVTVGTVPPPPRPAIALATPAEGSLVPSRGQRYLNGSILDARDAQGQPRRVVVLSHYMNGHSSHLMRLPEGWSLVGVAHRGEYDVVDGKIARLNATSGDAARERVANPVVTAESYFTGSALATPRTRYLPYEARNAHLYDGFNEPGGTPANLHSLRHRVNMGFHNTLAYLEMNDAAYMAERHPGNARDVLDHWDIFTSGVTDSRLPELRAGLTDLANGRVPPDDTLRRMTAMMQELKARMDRIEVLEIPVE